MSERDTQRQILKGRQTGRQKHCGTISLGTANCHELGIHPIGNIKGEGERSGVWGLEMQLRG